MVCFEELKIVEDTICSEIDYRLYLKIVYEMPKEVTSTVSRKVHFGTPLIIDVIQREIFAQLCVNPQVVENSPDLFA